MVQRNCANIVQVADLSDNDLRWLVDHLGHNLYVHREFYRLRDSTIELAKVSRLLLSMDEGNASKLTGKKLSEINIEGKICMGNIKLVTIVIFCCLVLPSFIS